MQFLHRRALVGLLAGVCALAFPALASASISPTVTLSETSATPTAGTTGYHLGFDLKFNPSDSTDTAKNVTQVFPSGLLADSTLVNPGSGTLCILTPASDPNATNPSCQVANGTANVTGVGPAVPTAEYLVKAPNPAADVAGTLLVLGIQKVSVADVTVRPNDAGLNITFTGLPSSPQVTELNLTLTNLRLPSSCATNNLTVQAVSQEDATQKSTQAPLTVTGCPSQPYAPKVTSNVQALPNGGANVSANITQAADEAASKTIELDLPSSLSPSLADAGCLLGSPCQIGTASATTPLAPPQALANGTVTLGSTGGVPTITVSFPAPYALSFAGVVNTGTNTVTVNNVPDVPITSLSLNITHSQYGPAFDTTCAPSKVTAKFTGQGGQSSSTTVPINYNGSCNTPSPTAKAPTATGSLSGLSARKPVLTLHLTHGSNAPNLSSVAISLSSGLNFNSKGIVKHKHCSGKGKHKKCTVTITAAGMSLSGASLKSFKLSSGRFVIRFGPAGQVTVTLRGPLLAETKSLQKKVKKHKVKQIPVTVKMTDANGKVTSITLKLSA